MPQRFGSNGFLFELVEDWPAQPIQGVAATVAADSTGRVYVGVRNIPPGGGVARIRPGIGHVLVLNPDGTVADNWGDQFSSPHAIWINEADEVFVADTGLHTITKHAPSGELLLTLGTTRQAGEHGKPFNMPTAMAQAPNGDIIVSDGYGQNWMHRFSEHGEHILSWGGGNQVFLQRYQGGPVTDQPSTEPGQFNVPHDVLVTPSGQVFVMDRDNSRWQQFDLDGTFVAVVEGLTQPCDAAVDADGIFHIAGYEGVEIWSQDGKQLATWGDKSAGAGPFEYTPHGCWIDGEGSFYVAEVGQNNVLKKFRRL